jgi:hypothetical protein
VGFNDDLISDGFHVVPFFFRVDIVIDSLIDNSVPSLAGMKMERSLRA